MARRQVRIMEGGFAVEAVSLHCKEATLVPGYVRAWRRWIAARRTRARANLRRAMQERPWARGASSADQGWIEELEDQLRALLK